MNSRKRRALSRVPALLALATSWLITVGCRQLLGIENQPIAECVYDSDCAKREACVSNECVSACQNGSCAGASFGGAGVSEAAGASEGGDEAGASGGFAGTSSGAGASGTTAGNSGTAGTQAGGTGGSGGDEGGVGGIAEVGGGVGGTGGGDGECNVNDTRCFVRDPKLPAVVQSCESGAWQLKEACRDYCRGGSCINSPSCSSSGGLCGPKAQSCCQATEIPGGTFKRSYDGQDFNDDSFEASVSSFALDKFEVTVGRFRKFVATYPLNLPNPGDGKATLTPGDPGWSSNWPLPADKAALIQQLKCEQATWEDTPTSSPDVDQRPINCVSFYLAYAFCIWDGGRLPTEAEWNYAASGGSEQRVYPWSAPHEDTTITPENAVYYDGTSEPDLLPSTVGSKSCTTSRMSCGDGRWGQADLAGNVSEWNLDYFAMPYPTTSCTDCWNTVAQPRRSVRGGSYLEDASSLYASQRADLSPTATRNYLGFRCAHEMKH
jgi:sulfatase modifying factor 1